MLAAASLLASSCAARRAGLHATGALAHSPEDFDAGAMVRRLRTAMSAIVCPSKADLASVAKDLGAKYERRLPGYRFLTRGGLFSPYVQYVTDMNMIFNRDSGEVSPSELAVLEDVAALLFGSHGRVAKAKITMDEEVKFDSRVEDMDQVRDLVEEGADLVVLTGRFRTEDGWWIPMDVVLQNGEAHMSDRQRFNRILENIRQGNYAKAVQRIRALLRGRMKKTFGYGWNDAGSKLRFLVRQLELLRDLPDEEAAKYMDERLHLPDDPPPEAWAEVAEKEMQKVALAYLVQHRRLIRDSTGFGGCDIVEALDAIRSED